LTAPQNKAELEICLLLLAMYRGLCDLISADELMVVVFAKEEVSR
jgi:hypothetical protein